MNRDPRLERYLTTLESALKPFPVGDRAEIITEIRSHVLSALERDPSANVDTILSALGEPEIVANRYLLERGLKPAKPPISPIVRWVVIGFLGTLAMMLLFAGFVISQFSPIVKVDEKANKVEILGGMIKVDGDQDQVTIRGLVDDGFYSGTGGSVALSAGQALDVKFKDGKVAIVGSEKKTLDYYCYGNFENQSGRDFSDGATNFDLAALGGVRCKFEVPFGVKVKIVGEDGHLSIDDADFDIDARLERGHLEFEAKNGVAFKFDVKVDTGKADSFESSADPKARVAQLHVGSGRISNDTD